MDRIARALGQAVLENEPISGMACRVRTAGGDYFCKVSSKRTDLFREEAFGLKALTQAGALRVPGLVFQDDHLLILEWIESERPTSGFWSAFGTQLAGLHKQAQSAFGFEIDNHIGPTPQANPARAAAEISWADYFVEFRLQPMLRHATVAVDSLVQALYTKAERRLHEELTQVTEPPSLLHGDLWGGNFLCGPAQTPYLIDPAPYRGHREADLAMSELFGGFDSEFYGAYKARYPLQPGYERRKAIYNLYHLLNHWILFGSSYRESVCANLRSL